MPTPMLARADVLSPTPLPAAVDTRTPSSVRRAREAERRQLTVLVCGCDAFESEPYLELDSEDQADVLRAFLETCEKAVQQFGGTIVQSSEKGVVACFGFPLAYEDAAGRAARTGLAILEGMKIPGERRRIADTLNLHPWVGDSYRGRRRRVEGGRRVAGGRGAERGGPARRRGRRRSGDLYRRQPPPVPRAVSVRLPRPAEDQERSPARRTVPGGARRSGRESD